MFTICSRLSPTPRPMTYYYTYILAGQDARNNLGGPIYIGTARDLKQRLFQHRAGRSSKKAFRIDKLVYAQRHNSIEAATARAEALKSASRVWVKALIERGNPDWRDLSQLAKERLARAA